jgi:hypothetical protein
MEKHKEDDVYLPKRTDEKYSIIENYSDYAYTYCIAYEMLIRTKEFQAIKIKPEDETVSKWEEKVKELGLNPYAYPFEEMYLSPIADVTFALNESFYSYTINDVNDGLTKLIIFYIDNDGIYLLEDECDEAFGIKIPRYKKSINPTLEQVLLNLQKYYIPCNPDQHIAAINAIDPIKQLHKSMPLDLLEKRFLATLSSNDLQEKYIQVEPRYKRPTLRFKESKVINLPVNLNLSKEELVEYISQIKDEYDHGKARIKNPLETIGKILNKASRSNNLKKLRKHKKNRKAGMADAFFVYDVFQILQPYFEDKKKEIMQQKEKNIKEIRHRKDIDKADKESLIKDEKEKTKKNKGLYSKDDLYKKIAQYGKLPEYNIKAMYEFMQEYIDPTDDQLKPKYQELITGIASN